MRVEIKQGFALYFIIEASKRQILNSFTSLNEAMIHCRIKGYIVTHDCLIGG